MSTKSTGSKCYKCKDETYNLRLRAHLKNTKHMKALIILFFLTMPVSKYLVQIDINGLTNVKI